MIAEQWSPGKDPRHQGWAPDITTQATAGKYCNSIQHQQWQHLQPTHQRIRWGASTNTKSHHPSTMVPSATWKNGNTSSQHTSDSSTPSFHDCYNKQKDQQTLSQTRHTTQSRSRHHRGRRNMDQAGNRTSVHLGEHHQRTCSNGLSTDGPCIKRPRDMEAAGHQVLHPRSPQWVLDPSGISPSCWSHRLMDLSLRRHLQHGNLKSTDMNETTQPSSQTTSRLQYFSTRPEEHYNNTYNSQHPTLQTINESEQ